MKYPANKKTQTIHLDDCEYAAEIGRSNLEWYEELYHALGMGYSECRYCLGQGRDRGWTPNIKKRRSVTISEARKGEWSVWTDGSCQFNPDGPGGWGAVLKEPGGQVREISGGEASTTSNRMEFEAVCRALEAIPEKEHVIVYSDSKLAINVLSGKWRGRKNRDLVTRGLKLVSKHRVRFQWVPAHSEIAGNERADELAGAAMRSWT